MSKCLRKYFEDIGDDFADIEDLYAKLKKDGWTAADYSEYKNDRLKDIFEDYWEFEDIRDHVEFDYWTFEAFVAGYRLYLECKEYVEKIEELKKNQSDNSIFKSVQNQRDKLQQDNLELSLKLDSATSKIKLLEEQLKQIEKVNLSTKIVKSSKTVELIESSQKEYISLKRSKFVKIE